MTDKIISITSVPFRFKNELLQVLLHLQNKTLGYEVVVSIPKNYRKGWQYDINDLKYIEDLDNVSLNLVDTDWGPATKLLGGIDWVRKNKLNIESIITLDDDILFLDVTAQLSKLVDTSKKFTDKVITFNGLRLMHPPYYAQNGLYNVNEMYCNAVAGYLGVLYPSNFFNDNVAFELINNLDIDLYSEDDAYFGSVAFHKNIDIWSTSNHNRIKILSGKSAVEIGLEGETRIDREGKIYNYLLENNMIKVLEI